MLNTSTNEFEGLPLFQAVASRTCNRCFDTGLWLASDNAVEMCPGRLRNESHASPNAAAQNLCRSVKLLNEKQIWINPQAFDLARLLTNFDSKTPCPRQEIFDTFYDTTTLSYQNQLRKFHALIEELRSIWLLPVGSRKTEPSGYWVVTELADFREWFERVKAAPVTQLITIYKVARHNFPVFAEQMELQFLSDIQTETEAR